MNEWYLIKKGKIKRLRFDWAKVLKKQTNKKKEEKKKKKINAYLDNIFVSI